MTGSEMSNSLCLCFLSVLKNHFSPDSSLPCLWPRRSASPRMEPLPSPTWRLSSPAPAAHYQPTDKCFLSLCQSCKAVLARSFITACWAGSLSPCGVQQLEGTKSTNLTAWQWDQMFLRRPFEVQQMSSGIPLVARPQPWRCWGVRVHARTRTHTRTAEEGLWWTPPACKWNYSRPAGGSQCAVIFMCE